MVDAFWQVGDIITRFERKGFQIVGLKMFQTPKSLAEVRIVSYVNVLVNLWRKPISLVGAVAGALR